MFKYLKNIVDFFAAFILALILFPFLVILSILLLISLKGNPFFYQKRIGLKLKPFNLVKFRSMTSEVDADGVLLPDKYRLTKVGQLLRNLSLDELPQLLNVMKGEMSIVGPRPLLPEYVPLYNDFQNRRHEVKPGITGWAQVNGRNAITWQEKFKLDVWYVKNQSVLLDVKILLLTILKVVKKDGISSETSSTMERFTGNK